MTKQEFWVKWRSPRHPNHNIMKSDLYALIESEIQQAIASHEAEKDKLITDSYEKGWNVGFEQGKKHQTYQEGGEG